MDVVVSIHRHFTAMTSTICQAQRTCCCPASFFTLSPLIKTIFRQRCHGPPPDHEVYPQTTSTVLRSGHCRKTRADTGVTIPIKSRLRVGRPVMPPGMAGAFSDQTRTVYQVDGDVSQLGTGYCLDFIFRGFRIIQKFYRNTHSRSRQASDYKQLDVTALVGLHTVLH